ncbi:hypothetical protein [Microcoleus anatoxicus]|uniref:hypothetical protein n=1 Tax=Microcoleus anatoxicus TaxID=2705319 RepID=UPI0030C94804
MSTAPNNRKSLPIAHPEYIARNPACRKYHKRDTVIACVQITPVHAKTQNSQSSRKAL